MLTRTGMFMVVTIVLVTLLVGCSGDNDNNDDDVSESAGQDAPAMDAVDEADADSDEAALATDDSSGQASQISTSSWDRKVIRSGELELVVEDVSRASRNARELVADHGGYIASSSTRTLREDEERTDLEFEVPAESFETVMTDLADGSQVIRVKHESTRSQDVTEEYVDLESRLANLESTETRFVELLDEAHDISEILSVENEISRIRGEIEQIQGRLNYLEQRTDYSRIHLSLSQDEDEDVTVAGQTFTPGETAREAWNASMEFVGTLGNAAITVIVFFWWAWPVLLIAGFAVTRYRRRARVEEQAV